ASVLPLQHVAHGPHNALDPNSGVGLSGIGALVLCAWAAIALASPSPSSDSHGCRPRTWRPIPHDRGGCWTPLPVPRRHHARPLRPGLAADSARALVGLCRSSAKAPA